MKTIFNKISFILPILLVVNLTHAQNCVGTAGQVKWSYWSGFASIPDTTDLYVLEFFPSTPDAYQILGSLKSPVNYGDLFASMIRGYIKVPTTNNYVFNLTADEKAIFFLSTNQSPANKIKRAEVLTFTGQTEYNKEPGQTSQTIQLIGGQYYYFEMYNFDGGGGDFMNLQWRKANETPIVWSIIDFNYIYDYGCSQVCPTRGTACSDGNPLTTNDQQDGFCNCVGIYPTTNACVGTKGLTEAYYYDNVLGSFVEYDLVNAPKFPLLPDRKEKLKGAYGPLAPFVSDNYGTLVQGFLTVPISGTYEFNITGDNQTFFFLSKNDSIEYKQYHQAIVINGILDENDHNSSVLQNIPPIYMEKGKYYYFEFRHKENAFRDHFTLFWKTPFHEKRNWKRVPNYYLFDYKCEISCIAENTPCDDGNPFTNDDKINSQCECVGTPCSGLDCDDEAARYKNYDSCSPTDNIVPLVESSWVTCNSTIPNPNPARASNVNWIRYDLSDIHQLSTTRIWNYNISGETNKGFKNVRIDYSLDGISWQALGANYLWPQAPGTTDYSGFSGPNFNNIKARYILISAIDNWGGSCYGFSKITFQAALCNPSGTACDDNDPLTSMDRFDANCNCRGIPINCTSDTLKLSNISLADGAFKAKKRIESESIIPLTKDVSFIAGNSIVLLPGFQVNNSAVFKANIEDCLQEAFKQNKRESMNLADTTILSTNSTKSANLKEIIFKLTKPSQVKLLLKDNNDKVVVSIVDHYIENIGTQTKFLPINKLAKGSYWIELVTSNSILREQILVE